ncbi:Phage tail length tape-measure protein 1 [Acinetobacter guillouiae MSP4-18]|uniref:tape measure protein n=2 Tax=Acinetobacter guillouiae TaxID=106649 RepID=UPI00035478F1|nr:tape measure protein [Acinetobacter guillouiae]EPH31538.1 Phage tail length tape-measure protein 1 [Acinetobacter guillouiae MSP4-18]KAB0622237.1 tape measure protein [Acinetobacter guillouiae]
MAEQRSTLIIEISSEQAARNARALDRELQSIERTGNYATTSMNSMSVAARQLAGYLAGVVTVGTAIAKMDTYTGLNNKLKLVTKSQSELNTAMNDTFKIAQNTAQAWDSVAQIYQRFSDNAKRLNITQAKTAELTDTVAKAIAISGGSAASAEAALVQFSQALASNVLRGEELNSVMEQAPGLAKAIAQGMGITVGQLRSVAAEGKITGDVLVDALTKARGSVNELFGKTDFTIAQSFTQLSNEVTKFVGEAGKGSGAANAISGSLTLLAENLNNVTNIAMIGGAYWVGTYIPALYKSVVAGYGKATQLVEQTAIQWAAIEAEKVAAAQELAGAEAKLVNLQATRAQLIEELKLELARKKKQISDQGAINSDIRMGLLRQQQAAINTELTATENALAAARTRSAVANNATMGAGRGLLGLFGGAGGLVGIVAAVGASMLLMRDNTDSATNSLNIQKQSVREIAAEYSKLSAAKLISEMDEIDKRIKKSQSDASKARDSLLGMVTGNSESISNEEIKRQNLMLDQLKKIKEEGLSTAAALQNLSKSKLFTDGEIKSAQRYFAQLDEGISSAREFGYQKELANSYMAKASGLYEKNADKISKLTNESERLNESYSNSKESIIKSAESFLQISENSGASAKQLIIAKNALDSYSKGTISATQLSQIFLENLPIPQKTIDSFIAQSKQADGYKNSVAGVNVELKKQIDFRNTYLSQHQGVLAAEKEVTEEKRKQLANEQRLSELRKSANKSMLDDNYWINTYNRELKNIGGDKQKASTFADFALNWRKENKIERDVQLTTEQAKILNDLWVLDQKRKTLSDEASKSEKERTKEFEKQQKLQEKQAVALAGNNEQVRNMLRVYQAFRNTGLGDKQARVMTAQVGRENDFRSSAMFGSHGDFNNGFTNTGFFSWQKGRSANLMKFLQGQGMLDKNGKIQQTQDALDAMAKYAMQEVATVKSYSKTKNALTDDNLSYRDLEKIIGKNFVGWDYNGNGKLGKVNAGKHLAKQDGYYNKLSNLLGSDPENSLSSIKMWAKFDDEAFKARAKTEDEIKQLQAKYDTEAIQRSKARDEEITQATILGQTQLLPKIKERYNAQDKLAKLQQDYELNGYKYTEDQKLIYQRDSAKEQLDAEGKYSDDVKALRKKAYDDLYDYELEKSKLAKDQRLLQSTEFYMSEIQLAKAKYDIERRLLDQSNEDPKEKVFKSQMLELQNQVDMNRRLKDASMGWDSVQSQMNGSTGRFQVNQDKFSRMGASQNLFDTQIADVENQEQEPGADLQKLAEVREQIWAAHNQRMIDIENQYQTDSLNLQLTQAQQLTGSFANMFKGILGESSGAYKTMFAMQQAFSIASSMVAAYTAYSTAFADPSAMTLTQKFAGGAAVMAALMPAITSISSISLKGMAHNGIDNIPSEGTWLLDGGERVLNPQQNKDLTNYLSNSKSQGPNIVINNNGSSKVTARQGADGKIYVTVDEVQEIVAGQLRNPNSQISKSVQQNTTATRRR